MGQVQNVLRGFERAGVPLRVADRPLVFVNNDEVVQMDVRRAWAQGRPREEVQLWPGKGAEFAVTGTDALVNQLVLRVQEARRKFFEQVWDPKARRRVAVERWTSPARRRFLIGMDEAHLFVAQLTTPATTVADAHRGLRPAILATRPEAFRQGEWFFAPATDLEKDGVRRQWRRAFQKNARIGADLAMRGRAHLADQLVRFTIPQDETGRVELVRGRVRHPDHATLELGEWMRVFVNTENRAVGASWVD